jgi:hypothetical protein
MQTKNNHTHCVTPSPLNNNTASEQLQNWSDWRYLSDKNQIFTTKKFFHFVSYNVYAGFN